MEDFLKNTNKQMVSLWNTRKKIVSSQPVLTTNHNTLLARTDVNKFTCTFLLSPLIYVGARSRAQTLRSIWA